MGPILLFDKSFIQSLSLDESVWLDAFFLTNVCPIFYVETLADIEKQAAKGRPTYHEVRMAADKFPQLNSAPCALHSEMSLQNLLGNPVPMTGQIPLAHSRIVNVDGELGAISEDSPVAAAFLRWQDGKFLEVERDFARAWRAALANQDLSTAIRVVKELGIDPSACTSLAAARSMAASLATSSFGDETRFGLALQLLDIPTAHYTRVLNRWQASGRPSLREFAPYAAFILEVEAFFATAFSAGLAYTKRASTRVDSAYLYYLPHCMVFASSDKFHRDTAPLFLRPNQDFLWGPELKAALRHINSQLLSLSDSEKARGVLAIAQTHPECAPEFLVRLWDKQLPAWRNRDTSTSPPDPKAFDRAVRAAQLMESARTQDPAAADSTASEVKSVLIKRTITAKRGSWRLVPPKSPSKSQ